MRTQAQRLILLLEKLPAKRLEILEEQLMSEVEECRLKKSRRKSRLESYLQH